MTEIRRVVVPPIASTDCLIIAKRPGSEEYELAAHLQMACTSFAPGFYGSVDDARKGAQGAAARLGISVIYEVVS